MIFYNQNSATSLQFLIRQNIQQIGGVMENKRK